LTETRIEGRLARVKTTIDIPEPLYKQAKIRAVERGETLRTLVVRALERDLDRDEGALRERTKTFAERRRLLPEFEAAIRRGALRAKAGTDVTQLISEDRNSREDALL
jgi:hypothetical protein